VFLKFENPCFNN